MKNMKNIIIIILALILAIGFVVAHRQIIKLEQNAKDEISSLKSLNDALEQQLIVEMGLDAQLYGLNCND